MPRVLVTGGSGFIGRHLLGTLAERGFQVHAVTRGNSPAIDAPCYWHASDLLDQDQVAPLLRRVKPTHLLHLAWYTVPGEYWSARENFAWVQSSVELLRRFHEVGGTRVVMAGTCAEYDWSYGWCCESRTPTAPQTTYGTCKQALHTLLDAFVNDTGISAAWGRIFFLYGPHEHPSRLVSSVIRSLLQGEEARCTAGTQIRDFLHVSDAANAFVALLESCVHGAVNIASGEPVRISEVVTRIAAKIGRHDLLQLGALPISPSDPPLLCADVRRVQREVGWSPDYDLSGGLDQTIQWWKRRQSMGGAL